MRGPIRTGCTRTLDPGLPSVECGALLRRSRRGSRAWSARLDPQGDEMKRAATAIGIVVLLLATFGTPASAGERRRTQTAQYTGLSWEADCRTQRLQEVNSLLCRAAKTAHTAVFSGRTRFRAPSWARSVRVSIKDDSGRPVAFRVYFDKDATNAYRFRNSTCAQRATLNLRRNTKQISIARIEGCAGALPTKGVVAATFSAKRTANPSPRDYVRGCSSIGVSGVGLGAGGCSYTASKAGGYSGVGYWGIRIVRGNETIELDSLNDPRCAATGFIHAGDLVFADTEAGYVAAGDDVNCEWSILEVTR
jgi:hypothetical protein